MDLTQLANLGEFIGGIAVLVTLIYLAVQVRQGTALARATAQRDVNRSHQENLDRMAGDPVVFQRGLHDFDRLTKSEQLQFNSMAAPIVNHLDQTMRMFAAGLETRTNLEAYAQWVTDLVREPGGRMWWNQTAPFFVQEVRDFLVERLATTKPGRPMVTVALPWLSPDENGNQS